MYFQSVNGVEIDQISTLDRGLAYGDGLFTTAKIVNGNVQMLEQHIERLRQGCERFRISDIDYVSLESQLVKAAKPHNIAVLKVIVTSGDGGRGYSRVGTSQPNVIIKTSEYPEKYDQWKKSGISVSNASIKLGINPLLAGIKHLNRLEQVFLREELDQTLFDDLMVFDLNDMLVETTCANIFWIKQEQLFTPEIKNSGVAGLLRNEIIKYFPSTRVVSDAKSIINADSIFITNSVMEIVPVLHYQGKQFDINSVHQFISTFKSLAHD
jgi:4-amino-4-deoxychorismate lyase